MPPTDKFVLPIPEKAIEPPVTVAKPLPPTIPATLPKPEMPEVPAVPPKPVPLQPFSEAVFDADNSTIGTTVAGGILATPNSGGDAPQGIQDLWFVPRWDAAGNEFIPVYAVVEDL